MSYHRVLPRDLFNEANLLKCIGQLWLLLEGHGPSARIVEDSLDEPFRIEQDPNSGAIFVANVTFEVGGVSRFLSRPLNSRRPWPLYVTADDDEEMSVFNDDGQFSEEMQAFIDAQAS